MPVMRRLVAAGLAASLLVNAGCAIIAGGAVAGGMTGAAISDTPRVQPGAPIQLRLPSPRDVALLPPLAEVLEAGAPSAPEDTVWLPEARLLIGRVTAVRGDTLWLRLTEARSGEQRLTYPTDRGPFVRLVGEEAHRVEPLGSQPMAAVLGAFLGAGAGLVFIMVLCSIEPCFS